MQSIWNSTNSKLILWSRYCCIPAVVNITCNINLFSHSIFHLSYQHPYCGQDKPTAPGVKVLGISHQNIVPHCFSNLWFQCQTLLWIHPSIHPPPKKKVSNSAPPSNYCPALLLQRDKPILLSIGFLQWNSKPLNLKIWWVVYITKPILHKRP